MIPPIADHSLAKSRTASAPGLLRDRLRHRDIEWAPDVGCYASNFIQLKLIASTSAGADEILESCRVSPRVVTPSCEASQTFTDGFKAAGPTVRREASDARHNALFRRPEVCVKAFEEIVTSEVGDEECVGHDDVARISDDEYRLILQIGEQLEQFGQRSEMGGHVLAVPDRRQSAPHRVPIDRHLTMWISPEIWHRVMPAGKVQVGKIPQQLCHQVSAGFRKAVRQNPWRRSPPGPPGYPSIDGDRELPESWVLSKLPRAHVRMV